jgi:hypothetical protein
MLHHVTFRVTVPLNTNDGGEVSAAMLDHYVKTAIDIAGGCTFHPEAQGYWESNGRLYCDRVRVLEIMVKRSDAVYTAHRVGQLAKRIANELNQECVLVTRSDCSAAFVEPS